MKLTIKSDGTSQRTHLELIDDQLQRHVLPHVTAVTWTLDAPGKATAVVHFHEVELDVELPQGQFTRSPGWYTRAVSLALAALHHVGPNRDTRLGHLAIRTLREGRIDVPQRED